MSRPKSWLAILPALATLTYYAEPAQESAGSREEAIAALVARGKEALEELAEGEAEAVFEAQVAEGEATLRAAIREKPQKATVDEVLAAVARERVESARRIVARGEEAISADTEYALRLRSAQPISLTPRDAEILAALLDDNAEVLDAVERWLAETVATMNLAAESMAACAPARTTVGFTAAARAFADSARKAGPILRFLTSADRGFALLLRSEEAVRLTPHQGEALPWLLERNADGLEAEPTRMAAAIPLLEGMVLVLEACVRPRPEP
ncbi:MAG: hypothetical protein OYL41_00455 [Acidobacteriota bacterium]|nr:hypothetical protein [Acidobacteriota bacterium]